PIQRVLEGRAPTQLIRVEGAVLVGVVFGQGLGGDLLGRDLGDHRTAAAFAARRQEQQAAEEEPPRRGAFVPSGRGAVPACPSGGTLQGAPHENDLQTFRRGQSCARDR